MYVSSYTHTLHTVTLGALLHVRSSAVYGANLWANADRPGQVHCFTTALPTAPVLVYYFFINSLLLIYYFANLWATAGRPAQVKSFKILIE
jgi:hypothetical protein